MIVNSVSSLSSLSAAVAQTPVFVCVSVCMCTRLSDHVGVQHSCGCLLNMLILNAVCNIWLILLDQTLM